MSTTGLVLEIAFSRNHQGQITKKLELLVPNKSSKEPLNKHSERYPLLVSAAIELSLKPLHIPHKTKNCDPQPPAATSIFYGALEPPMKMDSP